MSKHKFEISDLWLKVENCPNGNHWFFIFFLRWLNNSDLEPLLFLESHCLSNNIFFCRFANKSCRLENLQGQISLEVSLLTWACGYFTFSALWIFEISQWSEISKHWEISRSKNNWFCFLNSEGWINRSEFFSRKLSNLWFGNPHKQHQSFRFLKSPFPLHPKLCVTFWPELCFFQQPIFAGIWYCVFLTTFWARCNFDSGSFI